MTIEEELSILKRNCVEIISEDELLQKIKLSRETHVPLKIKAGFDPTTPDIHLGHTVLLHKLKDFQTCGHQVFFLIGDFTAQIGDPTGQSITRKRLTHDTVMKNAETYTDQVFKILDPQKTTVLYNSQWCDKLSFEQILTLTSKFTIARMLERNDFSDRFKNNQPISIIEFLYPLVQAYDSVETEADIEIGGNDQKFNLLLGRHFQKEYDLVPQVVMMLPLLKGLDGKKKMSKSFHNSISLNTDSQDMFGQIMSISDDLMFHFYELLTDFSEERIEGLKQEIAMELSHPKSVKENLAKTIVSIYYDDDQALACLKEFNNVFQQKKVPQNIPDYQVKQDKLSFVEIIYDSHLCSTKSEARRMIQQGAVRIEGEKISDVFSKFSAKKPIVLKCGKKKFLRLFPTISTTDKTSL